MIINILRLQYLIGYFINEKFLGIVVLGLLWCSVGFAAKEKALLKEYINDGKIYKGMTKIQLSKVTNTVLVARKIILTHFGAIIILLENIISTNV